MEKRNLYDHDNKRTMELIELAKREDYEVCIWGAGTIGRGFGIQILRNLGIHVDYYCDNNKDLHNKEIVDGVMCESPARLIEKKEKTICFLIIRCDCMEQVNRQLYEMGVENFVTYDDLLILDSVIRKYLPFIDGKNMAVYTCITGDYDELREPTIISEKCDYFVISDNPPQAESVYQWIDIENVVPMDMKDNISRNRYCKINPHLLFKDYRYSVYHDGNVRIDTDFLECISQLGKTRVAVAGVNRYQSVFEEMMRCIAGKRTDSADIYIEQAKRYWNQGMPYFFTSFLCNVLLREHNNPVCVKLMDDWWHEFSTGARRDQISFPYVLWKNGFQKEDVYAMCAEGIDPWNDSPYWKYFCEHKKKRLVLD